MYMHKFGANRLGFYRVVSVHGKMSDELSF